MSLNYLAILLAAVSSMLVGTLWFAPAIFGRKYAALTGVDPNKPKRPALVYLLAFASALVTAYVLSYVALLCYAYFGTSQLLAALSAGSFLWLGFTAATTAVHYLFEGRPARLYAINMGHQLVTVLVMAVIIGLLV